MHAACQIAAVSALLGLSACGSGPVIIHVQAGAGGSAPSGGAGGAAADGGTMVCAADGGDAEFSPSDYDQSCTVASDCVAVPQGDVCYPCIRSCPSGTVNRGAEAAYLADIAKVVPAGEPEARCNCPALFNPCCLDNKCHSDLQCQTAN
jgi:hypothetical protein